MLVHGKEGAAGSSPAEGFRNRATARFSHSRSGLDDHFHQRSLRLTPAAAGRLARRADMNSTGVRDADLVRLSADGRACRVAPRTLRRCSPPPRAVDLQSEQTPAARPSSYGE